MRHESRHCAFAYNSCLVRQTCLMHRVEHKAHEGRYLSWEAADDDMLLHVYTTLPEKYCYFVDCITASEPPLQSLVIWQPESQLQYT